MGSISGAQVSGVRRYADVASAPVWSAFPTVGGATTAEDGVALTSSWSGQTLDYTIANGRLPAGTVVGDYIVIFSMPGTYTISMYLGASDSGWKYVGYDSTRIRVSGSVPVTSAGVTSLAIQTSNQESVGGSPFIIYKKITSTSDRITIGYNNVHGNMIYRVRGAAAVVTAASTPDVDVSNQFRQVLLPSGGASSAAVSPQAGLPYLWLFGATIYTGVSTVYYLGNMEGQLARTAFSSTGASHNGFARRVYADKFNSIVSITGADFAAGWLCMGIAFQATPPSRTPLFSVTGEALIDRLEIVNNNPTEARSFAIISGNDITSGSVDRSSSVGLGPAYLNNEGVEVFQVDGGANNFRTLAIGRPVI